jgi:sigma-B regulation protein RsbU (phosphoserine phosphatase)
MNALSTSEIHALRPRILERRARLLALSGSLSADYLNGLLAEIDHALRKIDDGSYGRCETCREPIEPARLDRNPLVRFCLDHLSDQERKAHQQDLDLAAEIQARLLPPKDLALPQWETYYRYEPAGAVGGDYCELIPSRDGNSLFFAVGDVAGKGVAASLLMTHLSAILRSLLSLDLPLAEVVSRANRLFSEGTGAAHYATLACGRATPGGLELCNAGHCRPLLLQKDCAGRLDPTGLPLGLFPAARYEVKPIPMQAGDTLVLYSDGITEARNPEGVEYAEERLVDSLRLHTGRDAAAIAGAVLRDLARFRAGRVPHDDITLLIVRRTAC